MDYSKDLSAEFRSAKSVKNTYLSERPVIVVPWMANMGSEPLADSNEKILDEDDPRREEPEESHLPHI